LHSKDEKLLKSSNLYVKVFEGKDYIKIPKVDFFYDQIENKINIVDFSIQVLFTPGHTYGSVCLLIQNYLFTGDTLLKGKIGRTDLPGGNEDVLKKSLKTISKLPKHISIYAGHGASSTIKKELNYNQDFIETL
jgi:hydroxyacylglutathione hydrolase